jgi:3-dehydroquinate synthase
MSSLHTINIHSGIKNYQIEIGSDILHQSIHNDSIVISDEIFAPLLQDITDRVILINSSEKFKNLDSAEYILTSLAEMGANRKNKILAVGGGIIQDLATFAAGTYMRGVEWTYFPTTLMAMMDSCVGGKSSLNISKYKNLIGNFYPPNDIKIDLSFIKTLNELSIQCGMLEGIKICFAKGRKEYSDFKTYMNLLDRSDVSTFADIVFLSLNSKKWFVERDEMDLAERQLLNFGHTFGHALESSTAYVVPHGIAIGLGIKASVNFGSSLTPSDEYIDDLIMQVDRILAESEFNFENLVSIFNKSSFEDAFLRDKKHTSDAFRLILARNEVLEVISVPKEIEYLEKASSSMRNSLESMLK